MTPITSWVHQAIRKGDWITHAHYVLGSMAAGKEVHIVGITRPMEKKPIFCEASGPSKTKRARSAGGKWNPKFWECETNLVLEGHRAVGNVTHIVFLDHEVEGNESCTFWCLDAEGNEPHTKPKVCLAPHIRPRKTMHIFLFTIPRETNPVLLYLLLLHKLKSLLLSSLLQQFISPIWWCVT